MGIGPMESDGKDSSTVRKLSLEPNSPSQDTLALARSGKKDVLKRRFGFVSILGFSCGLMCTWESMLVAFLLGYQNGGPAGLIYGFIFVWLGNISVFISMGELASMIPTAGGQYYWVSVLAPKSARRFMSYITGWISLTAWVAGTTATAFFVSSLLQGLVQLNDPSYQPSGWQATLIFWGVLLICVFINTTLSKILPAIEVTILILHVLGFFAIILPLLWLAPKNKPEDVFTMFENAGGWSTQGLSFLIGLNGAAVAFVGGDGAIHMSEEIKDAAINVPKSIVLSLVINGALAFAVLITILFCLGDVQSSIENAPNGFPFMSIIASGIGSIPGATAMSSLILILELCSATAGLAAASRMAWSFARDRGLPFSSCLSKINKRNKIPSMAILTVFVCCALLGLIAIGNTTAFNAVVSLVLEGFYTSYFIACSLLLYRRLRGDIANPDTAIGSNEFEWGPWRVKGPLGVINNILALLYLLLIAFFSYWPTNLPVTPANMNYSILVLGVVGVFSTAYYFIWARKTYDGPIVEVQVVTRLQ